MGTIRSLKKVVHPTTPTKNNPYAHPSHPSHAPPPIAIPLRNSATTTTAAPRVSLDFPTEASEVDNQDSDTGRPLAERRRVMSDTSELWFETPRPVTQAEDEIERVDESGSTTAGPTNHNPTRAKEEEEEEEEEEEGENLSPYNARARCQIRTTGTRYDLFVQSLRLNPPPPPPRRSSSMPPQKDTSMYIARLSATRKNMGSRYDLFVKAMKERQEMERRERERAERDFSWYAPVAKPPIEYYAPFGRGR